MLNEVHRHIEDRDLRFVLCGSSARSLKTAGTNLYWADPGIPRAMKRQLGPVAAEERGHVFEGWIASVLRAHRDYGNLFDDWVN